MSQQNISSCWRHNAQRSSLLRSASIWNIRKFVVWRAGRETRTTTRRPAYLLFIVKSRYTEGLYIFPKDQSPKAFTYMYVDIYFLLQIVDWRYWYNAYLSIPMILLKNYKHFTRKLPTWVYHLIISMAITQLRHKT